MNWQNLTYRKKNKLLIGAAVLLLMISYFLPISRTIGLYVENDGLRDQLKLANSAPAYIEKLETESNQLNESFSYLEQEDQLRKELLEKIGRACEKYDVLFKNFKNPHIALNDDVTIETHEVVLQSTYTNLLKTIYELEHELKIGKVVAVSFRVEQNRRTKKSYLLAHVYVQSIKPDKHDKIS